MILDAFENLVDSLKSILVRDESMSRSEEPISVEIIVVVGIRFLAGDQILDIKNSYSLSKAASYNCVSCFLDAILSTDELKIKLPQTEREWNQIRIDFAKKSHMLIFMAA